MWMRYIVSLLEVSMGCSVVILGLMIVSPMLRKRFSYRWKYWIWLVLAIRLLIPMKVHILEEYAIPLPAVSYLQEVPADSVEKNMDFPKSGTLFIEKVKERINIDSSSVMSLSSSEDGRELGRQTHWYMVAIIWVGGMLVYMAYHFIAYHYIRHQIIRWSRPIQNHIVIDTIESNIARMRIKRSIRYYVSEKVSSPMMIGFLKPTLLLPKEVYQQDEIHYIIKHELIHYKRGDIWYKFIMLMANAVHWYNPVVYIMRSQGGKNIELFCDEEVVKGCSLQERKQYGQTIIRAIGRQHRCHTALSTYFNQDKKTVKDRLRGIVDMKRKKKGFMAFGVGVVCIFVISGLLVFGQKPLEEDGVVETVVTDTNSVESVDIEEINKFADAVLSNDIEYVNNVIADGKLDMNTPNAGGVYPLEMTLYMENSDMAKILIKAGADAELVTSDGKTIYEKAMENNSNYYKEIFKADKVE